VELSVRHNDTAAIWVRGTRRLLSIILLPVASGMFWFSWLVHDFGRSCGWRNLPASPNGPPTSLLALLVLVSAAVASARVVARGRPRLRVVGAGALAAVATFLAVVGAELAFGISRHCFG